MRQIIALFVLFSLLLLVLGCGGGGSKNNKLRIARCNNGELSNKQSCTEACQGQGGVREWFTDNCGPVP